MKVRAALVLALAAVPTVGAAGDEHWKVSGSARLRYEAVEGQVRPGFNASDDLVSLRTTLFAEYRNGPLRIGGELYDSRAWGGDRLSPISTNEVNVLEPVQAYVAIDGESQVLGKTTLQAGRFLLNLGSRRLVAADDYRNTTNSYSGVRFDFAPAGARATVVYVRPQLRLPDSLDAVLDNKQALDRESDALQLWGGIVAKPKAIGSAMLEGAFFRLDEEDSAGRATRNRRLNTASVRLIRDPAPAQFDFEIEAIHQTGKIKRGIGASDPDLNVRASFVHADVGYSFPNAWKPRLSAELDIATGDDAGGDYGRFDTLFGMRRADLAPAGIYNAIGRANIVTPGVRLEIAPSPRWDAFAGARSMWLEAAEDSFSTTGVRDAAGPSGRFAGHQLEGRLRYWIVKDRLRAEVNGVWLAKGRLLKRAPNAPRTGDDETYLSTSVTAQF